MKKKSDFRTPKSNIKIGEFGFDTNGTPVVSIKKAKTSATEEVPIMYLITMLNDTYHDMTSSININV